MDKTSLNQILKFTQKIIESGNISCLGKLNLGVNYAHPEGKSSFNLYYTTPLPNCQYPNYQYVSLSYKK
ncbi:MAG: hypothetical protein UV17_C0056G0005 [Candidatus Gottesmanbacteria bacterium GW2011_GWA1_42_26]|nr:MAG: hypothetical protein UV17_C0056G0005 [Candidatus Gottesmanbacteria bacterium GW2011_GWA1_42_26]OGG08705.1 MAG: hypothetical protein A2699_06210 [Candidatus Gottesmanbacteria bacterium RIFCSPHIGHO2_01_FULL_43_15]OGG28176.1 MAG: hypothetical protein A3A59_04095 [Candidatus Gottesmanbacteria bacterium RIFCSPLOWO2_01_FULL_42_10]HCM37059.1 hypothetical protein [Patescibacteria group bacterium]